ncbi:hypothetical protein [Williamsia sp.]|uniref:hypothetical protein n=1 Tax=Williamsia sp. TaxID=1872085 RepID=UPI002F95A3F3
MTNSSPSQIDIWWPQLNEQIRSVVVNNIWSPLAPYTLGEIARLGGPSTGDSYFVETEGDWYLPTEAVKWLASCGEFTRMARPVQSDPRAAYFKRSWPKR